MAPLILKQFTILLWKSWIMRKRHWISTIFELIFPLFLTILIVSFRADGSKGQKTPSESDHSHSGDEGKGWTGPVIYNKSEFTYRPYALSESDYDKYSIYYAPNNDFTNQIMDRIRKKNNNSIFFALENEAELATNLTAMSANLAAMDYRGIRYGVVFEIEEQKKYNIKYKLRSSDSLNAEKLYHLKSNSKPLGGSSIYEGIFTHLQIAINEAILDYISNDTRGVTKVANISGRKIPYPRYYDSGSSLGEGYISLQDAIAMMLILSYIAFCPLIVKRITDEKVAKAKEMLKMMGMSDWVFWGSHFLNYFSVMIIHSLLFTLFYFYGWGGVPFFMYSNAFLFFCIMILYSASTILSCMLLTTVFNRPIIAVVVTVILYIGSLAVPLPFLNPLVKHDINIQSTKNLRALSCFLPNMGLEWALSLIGQCETYGYGANWSNLWTPVSIFDDFTIGYVMLMMLISCFFYGFLIWYIDNVWPFQYGIPKPVYFLFLPSYWTTTKKSYQKMASSDSSQNLNYFETEPNNTRVGISCQSLRKSFRGKLAVNDVSLNMFSGQITVLLGHNGAGKTTTMNMITGIFPPTIGTALVDGYDIRTQTKDARRSMALCPQENILYKELDVYQHLKLYAILKDHEWSDVDNEVNKMLQLVALTDKKHTMSSQLSGGMKRKLSLAIAMIANSKILILDEPTSGMDPEARRHIWDVLQSIRTERTILLTTHYMEEADALGDRIAIMNEGLVKCCGTPMFLKRVFGAGYHLRITKNEFFNSQTVLNVVKNFMPNAEIKSEINSEIIYSLESEISENRDQNNSTSLAALFDELETRNTKLGINSCGLAVTTMEDVFLKVGNECNDNESFNRPQNCFSEHSTQIKDQIIKSMPKNVGFDLYLQQFKALLLKRIHYAKRYWPMIVLQLLLPGILFMCILLLDYSIKKSFGSEVPALELNLNMYGQTQGVLQSQLPEINDNYRIFSEQQKLNIEISDKDPNVWFLEGSKGDDLNKYIKTYLVGAQVNKTNSGLHLIPWYSNEAYHSLPPSINLLYESLFKLLFPSRDVSITVFNHPIPENNISNAFEVVMIGLIICCFLLTPVTVPFFGASYVLFPIHERTSKSKLLQLMNGISPLLFWGASFVFDLCIHLIACIFIFIIFAIFDWNQVFLGRGGTASGLFFMLLLFGFASIPLAYIISLRLKKPSSGFALLVIIYLISGIVLMFPLGLLDILNNTFGGTLMSSSTLDILLYVSRLLPVFSMSFGIQKLYKVGSYQSACNKVLPELLNATCNSRLDRNIPIWGCCQNLCKPTNQCYDSKNVFRWGSDGVAIEFTFLIISGFVYLLILWLIEENFERISYLMNSLIKRNEAKNELVFGLSFGVHKEECFGLLGVNGAGKTTTFRMLTGDETVSEGNAFIDYLDLRNNLKSFQKQIGYCPQFDALLDKMTGSETLYLFARLRGMKENVIASYVRELVEMVDLEKHVNKCTETYSGGNRRKLSLAIALCAAPPVIFLDEPTSGVDPSARRKIWSTLVHMQERYQSAIILTSHSMEECEALCSRIAIMVNGEFKCLGSVQHLRSKFGQGFTVMAKLKRELAEQSTYLADIQTYFKQRIPCCVLKDIHQCLLHYHIPDTSVLWSHMFRVMEEIKSKYFLEDYLISDTTLEQIFLAFARSQR